MAFLGGMVHVRTTVQDILRMRYEALAFLGCIVACCLLSAFRQLHIVIELDVVLDIYSLEIYIYLYFYEKRRSSCERKSNPTNSMNATF